MLTVASVCAAQSKDQYISLINSKLKALKLQASASDVHTLKTIDDIEDLFGFLCSSIDRKFYTDHELLLELGNYADLVAACTDRISECGLSYMLEDLKTKTASDLNLRAGFVLRKTKIKVRVIDRKDQRELAGYDVFVKPLISLDPQTVVQLNPTNNASGELFPGIKKVIIKYGTESIDEREVRIQYEEQQSIPVEIIFQVDGNS